MGGVFLFLVGLGEEKGACATMCSTSTQAPCTPIFASKSLNGSLFETPRVQLLCSLVSFRNITLINSSPSSNFLFPSIFPSAPLNYFACGLASSCPRTLPRGDRLSWTLKQAFLHHHPSASRDAKHLYSSHPLKHFRSSQCLQPLARMAAAQRSKRRRVYSLEPYAITYASFPCNYVSHLLPALIKATSITSEDGNKEEEIEKRVRFEVDMALALSTGSFRWSQALKQKLEHRINANRPYESPVCRSTIASEGNSHFGTVAKLDKFQTSQTISCPLVPVECNLNPTMKPDFYCHEETRPRRASQRRRNKKRMIEEEKEFSCRVRTLRRILPGGSEMGVCELLSEVESYMVCLELQVSILRSLVSTR